MLSEKPEFPTKAKSLGCQPGCQHGRVHLLSVQLDLPPPPKLTSTTIWVIVCHVNSHISVLCGKKEIRPENHRTEPVVTRSCRRKSRIVEFFVVFKIQCRIPRISRSCSGVSVWVSQIVFHGVARVLGRVLGRVSHLLILTSDLALGPALALNH